MTTKTKPTYEKPSDPEMFRHGKAHLLQIAAGKSKRAEAAQAELDRRARNKAAKKQKGRS